MPRVQSDDDTPCAPPRKTAETTAWVVVLLDGLLLGCGSFYWLARGRFFDAKIYERIGGSAWTTLSSSSPAVDRVTSAVVRLGGALGLCASLLVIFIALTGYRRGERWAWYAIWSLPLYCSLEIATLAGYGALTPTAALWNGTLLSLALLALIPPYRWFFARFQTARVLS